MCSDDWGHCGCVTIIIIIMTMTIIVVSMIISIITIIIIIITVGEVSTQAGSEDLYEAGWIGYI